LYTAINELLALGFSPFAKSQKQRASELRNYEGTSIGKENLRQVQDHPPQRRGASDLRKHKTQTAPGLKAFGWRSASALRSQAQLICGFSR
jgi:hypothetical protein